MKKLILITLCFYAASAHAEWLGDSLDQVGNYVQQKSDDTQQYIQQKKMERQNEQGTPAQSGQLATPAGVNDLVPDTNGILPDQKNNR